MDAIALVQESAPLVADVRLLEIVKNLNVDDQHAIVWQFSDAFLFASELDAKAKTIVVTDEKDEIGMNQAKFLRKIVKDRRCEIERTRKVLKEDSLNMGRAIDGVAKELTALIDPIEKYLILQETYAERMEKERKHKRAEDRKKEISTFLSSEQLSTPCPWNLEDMPEDKYQELLAGLTHDHLERVKAAEEKAAEEKRKAEELAALREQNERMRIEREVLDKQRREAEERERAAKREADEKVAKAAREAEEVVRLAAAKAKAEKDAAAALEEKRKKAETKAVKVALSAEYVKGWNDAIDLAVTMLEETDAGSVHEETVRLLKK